jgi:hypothetical protein
MNSTLLALTTFATQSPDSSIPTWVGFILTTATMFVVIGVNWGLQKSQLKELSDRHDRLQREAAEARVDHERRLAVLSQEAAATEVKLDQITRELGNKASAESVQEIKAQLSRIDAKLDALLLKQKERQS